MEKHIVPPKVGSDIVKMGMRFRREWLAERFRARQWYVSVHSLPLC